MTDTTNTNTDTAAGTDNPAPTAPATPNVPLTAGTAPVEPVPAPTGTDPAPTDGTQDDTVTKVSDKVKDDLFKPEPTEPDTPPEQVIEGVDYIDTSIKGITAELGVDADTFDEVYSKALEHGDSTLIDPTALGVDLTPEQAVRVQQLGVAVLQHAEAENERARNIVFSTAGGEDKWQSHITAFNSTATETQQQFASFLASKGDLAGAAKYVMECTAGKVNVIHTPAMQGGTGAAGVKGLSGAEYRQAIAAVSREAGTRSLDSEPFASKIADLRQQRTLGKSQGL